MLRFQMSPGSVMSIISLGSCDHGTLLQINGVHEQSSLPSEVTGIPQEEGERAGKLGLTLPSGRGENRKPQPSSRVEADRRCSGV